MDCKASGVDLDCQRAAYDSVFFRNREYEGQL